MICTTASLSFLLSAQRRHNLRHRLDLLTPYCITKALINAAEGKIDEALLFCGSNAYRCEKIETVPEVMAALCGE